MRPLKDYGYRYLVSEQGKIWSVYSNRFLTEFENDAGYLTVSLTKEGSTKSHLIHRIVAEAYLVNPLKKRTVNHKDGNPLNNEVSNLEWNTHSENLKHAYDNSLAKQRMGIENNRSSRLRYLCKDTQEIVGEVWGQAEAERVLGVPQGNISRALKTGGSAGGFLWEIVVEGVETIESTLKQRK